MCNNEIVISDFSITRALRIEVFFRGGESMKFYTIKLPKFIGGFVRAVIGTFRKN
ncbi:stage V sporulation protein SpoVM [Salipaludibacillus keqinensis]|uniref:Stage V sporulation protein SpoVM n=1 Tax=Salipaludibacillus keqinensis TaxID=2045207 RepID=A0A323TH16_9BACI|nr:stage V sporulation protein SpoVM [Salipaludibacillus keqinensis]